MAKAGKGPAYDKKRTAGLRKTIKSLDMKLRTLPDEHQRAIRDHLNGLSQQYGELLGFDHQSKDIHWLACWSEKGSSPTAVQAKLGKTGKKKIQGP